MNWNRLHFSYFTLLPLAGEHSTYMKYGGALVGTHQSCKGCSCWATFKRRLWLSQPMVWQWIFELTLQKKFLCWHLCIVGKKIHEYVDLQIVKLGIRRK